MNRSLKNLQSSTCQVTSERRVLDLELEVPGPILKGGNILPLENLEYIEVFKEPLAKIMEMAIGVQANSEPRLKDRNICKKIASVIKMFDVTGMLSPII